MEGTPYVATVLPLRDLALGNSRHELRLLSLHRRGVCWGRAQDGAAEPDDIDAAIGSRHKRSVAHLEQRAKCFRFDGGPAGRVVHRSVHAADVRLSGVRPMLFA